MIKGYVVPQGFMGLVKGKYQLFASESEYYEYMLENKEVWAKKWIFKEGKWNKMKYITYEEPLKGKTFTENQMHEVYRDLADKTEYPDFECWKTDMVKSGVFEEV